MKNPTPYQIRKKKEGIDSFDKYWNINPKTSEIYRIDLTNWRWFLNLLWRKKHAVETLYWWTIEKWATSEIITQTSPLKHDDIPFQGLLRKYQLTNGWTIPDNNLKFLKNGPLLNNQGTEILVNYQNRFKRIISFVSQLKPISWILSFVFVCLRYWTEILELWDKIKNAI
jgi:hypothetical protein